MLAFEESRLEELCLALFDHDGVALDLSTGAILGLNETAVFVYKRLLAGMPLSAVVHEVSREFDAPAEQVRADLEALFSGEASKKARTGQRAEGLQFRIDGETVVALWRGSVVARMDRTGDRVQLEVPPLQRGGWLKRLAPHVLTIRGFDVLHASSVEIRGSVYAFTGRSGVGKSTLAQQLGGLGARIESDDLLFVDRAEPPRVILGAESHIVEWCQAREREGGPVATDALRPPTEGRRAPLAGIWHLQRRASSSRLKLAALHGGRATALLLKNLFAEVPTREVWARTFDLARRLAMAGLVGRLTAPNGLLPLRTAATRWLRAPGAARPRGT